MRKLKERLNLMLFALATIPLTALNSYAAGSGMPWETPLNTILESVSGPIAKAVAIIAIIVTGLGLAFGEGGSGMRKLLWVVFGLSIAFAATGFFMTFFSFTGGVTI